MDRETPDAPEPPALDFWTWLKKEYPYTWQQLDRISMEVAWQAASAAQAKRIADETRRADENFDDFTKMKQRLATEHANARIVWQAASAAQAKHLAELERELEKEEKAHLGTIDQRDFAEEAISQAYYLMLGHSPEWSNNFGYEQALDEIKDAQSILRQYAKSAEQRLADTQARLEEAEVLLVDARIVVKKWSDPHAASGGTTAGFSLETLAKIDEFFARAKAKEPTDGS